MPHTHTSPTLALLLVLALGCSGPQSVEDLPAELREVAVLSVRSPGWRPAPDGTYTLLPTSRVLIDDPRVTTAAATERVSIALESGMRRRGLRLRPLGSADMLVGYVACLQDETDSRQVSALLGIDPGLGPAASGHVYDRGTLVVEIVSAVSRAPLWRGAVQAHWDLDLPDHVRKERVERAIERLLDDLYR